MAAVRPRTPGKSQPPPPPEPLPSSIDNASRLSVTNPDAASRRSSLGFLRRSKSTEPLSERKTSSSKASKKMKDQAREEELRRQRNSVPQHAPRLPDLAPAPTIQTFGGEEQPVSLAVPASESRASSAHQSKPPPPPPEIDPYARTESMTHRGRYSYASSAVSTINSPRRLRRRKDPTPYNLLVVGAKNSGKTSFLNFLRRSLALPANKHPIRSSEDVLEEINSSSTNPNFTSDYLETEVEGERVGLTLWDSEGLEKNVIDLQLRDITAFLESKFEDTLAEEMKVVRSPGARDTHIHCVFLILDPVRLDSNLAAAQKAAGQANGKYTNSSRVVGILDEEIDLPVLRVMQGKTAVVPIISKADTITTAHMAYLKKAVWDSLKQARIDPLEVLILEEAEEEQDLAEDEEEDEVEQDSDTTPVAEKEESEVKKAEGETESEAKSDAQPQEKIASASPPRSHKSNNSISTTSTTDTPFIPLSILSPDSHSLETPDLPIGRYFPWGYADPYNPEHCDFVKLKESVFKDWRAELREASREVCYERWRTSRLYIKQTPAPTKSANANSGRYGPPPVRGGRVAR